jgi:acyl-CoA synthetase (AMP-forming)/AMP-acid ligase II/thioesterase domain-containing protein
MSKPLQSLLGCGSIEDIGLALRWDPAVLTEEVTRRATILSQVGIGRGARVAIVHSGSARFFADLFAVWTVGATAVCLDSTLTSTELEIVCRFTEPAAVLVDRSTPSAELSAPILELATCRPSRVEAAFADPDPDDAALVLFTSGTTGSPKGVVLSFRALRTRVELNAAAIGATALKRALVTLPTHFGHGLIGNALTPLMAGGDIVLSPRGASLAEDLGRIIDKHEISFMSSVPALWHIVKRSSRPPSGNSLIRVHVGSAPLSAQSWSEIAAWSHAEVVNCYGMTETANWISGASSRSDGIADGLLGKPWGGLASVIDDSGRIQAAGTGEIVVKSPSLMSGYLNREDLTSAAKIDGWFRTGDRGTVDELGRIWLTGRIKDEINRAGFKVQPAEIDMLLETHPAIAETCVFAVPDPISGESVGAAIRFASGANLDIGSLRSWCRQRLRREAVPDRWFIVDHIPRNARGKVNRDALRRTLLGESDAAQCISENPDHAGSDHSSTVTLAGCAGTSTDDDLILRVRNAVEGAWTASLDEQSYRANLRWDEAGGDSIGALQLWHIIEKELGRQLPLEALTPGFRPSELVAAIKLIFESGDASALFSEASEGLPLVFFMAHAHGDVPSLAQFRATMKDRIRFVVIQYPQLCDMVDGRGGFDQLVDAAEEQIRAQCGGEPCRLLGFSFGGFIVWETARRLAETGQRIAFLGLIDSQLVAPRTGSFLARVSVRLFSWAWWRPRRLYSGCRDNLIELLTRFCPLSTLRRIDRLGMLLPAKAAFRFRHHLVSQFRSTSLHKERLQPLQIPATLFRSDEHVADLPDHGWNKLCNQLVVVPVRGGHNLGGDLPVDRGELSARLLQAIEISLNGGGKRGDANARLVAEGSR